jgi:hypothetical protein
MTTFLQREPRGDTLNLSMSIARGKVPCNFLSVDSGHQCHFSTFRWVYS